MRKLLIYMKDYKKESVLAPLFKLLEASLNCWCLLLWPGSLTGASETETSIM